MRAEDRDDVLAVAVLRSDYGRGFIVKRFPDRTSPRNY
jgi:hypothetical protein